MSRYQKNYNDDDDTNDTELDDNAGADNRYQTGAPSNPEEDSFKKRYGDLRRHLDSVQKAKDAEIEKLREQVNKANQKEVRYPKTQDEVQAWIQKYPDVAGIIETIVLSRTDEKVKEVNGELKRLKEQARQAEAETAYKRLLQDHPDFDDLRMSETFHKWINEQPQYIQDALYKNNTDVRAASRAIDLYKYETGQVSKKTTKKDVSRAAAESVNSRSSGSSAPSGRGKTRYSESMVEEKSRSSPAWFEQHEDEIMEAMRAGTFEYDLSGAAR